MSLDLIDELKRLSLSSILPLNKKPLNVCINIKEFEAFYSLKYSSRVLLNYKDMNILALKAGSLVRIRHDGKIVIFSGNAYLFLGYLLDNIFEVWPSILTQTNGTEFITFSFHLA